MSNLQFFRRVRENRPWIYVAMILMIFLRGTCECQICPYTGTCLHVYLYAFEYVRVAVGVHINVCVIYLFLLYLRAFVYYLCVYIYFFI